MSNLGALVKKKLIPHYKNGYIRVPLLMWIITGTVIAILLCLHSYNDILITAKQGYNFWNLLFEGRPGDFYLDAVMTTGNEYYPLEQGAYYLFPIYLVFAIWNFPTWIISNICGKDLFNTIPSMIWMKLMLIVFVVLSAKCIFRIVRKIDDKKEYAVLAGLNVCIGDCAVIKAADLQEPSELLLDMFSSWQQGNKVVLAVRKDREESFFTKLFANTYYWMVRKFVSKEMPKSGFDCYLIDRKVIEVLKSLDENNSALTLQILWAGFQKDIVYYTRLKREKGKSKWTFAKKIKLIVDSIISFSYVPIRIASIIGILCFLGSVIWAVVVFVSRLVGDIPVQGFTTLMILMLFSSGITLSMLGIIGEYVWRATDAARNRPNFIIDELLDDDNQEIEI